MNYINKATKLVELLQVRCTEKTICENYGQREISRFIEKIANEENYKNLSYSEQCDIKDILYKVSSITPKLSK